MSAEGGCGLYMGMEVILSQEMNMAAEIRAWRDRPIQMARGDVPDIGFFLGMRHETGSTPRGAYVAVRNNIIENAKLHDINRSDTLPHALSTVVGVTGASGAGKTQFAHGFVETLDHDLSLHLPDPDTHEKVLNGFQLVVVPVPFSMYTQAAKLAGSIPAEVQHGGYGEAGYAMITQLMVNDMDAFRRLCPKNCYVVFVVEASSPTVMPVIDDSGVYMQGTDRGLGAIFKNFYAEDTRDNTFLYLLRRNTKVKKFAQEKYRPLLSKKELDALAALEAEQGSLSFNNGALFLERRKMIAAKFAELFNGAVDVLYPKLSPQKRVVKGHVGRQIIENSVLIKLAQFMHVSMASPEAITKSDEQMIQLLAENGFTTADEYYNHLRLALTWQLGVENRQIGSISNPYAGYTDRLTRPHDIGYFMRSLPFLIRPSMNKWLREMVGGLPEVILPNLLGNVEEKGLT